MGDWVSMEKRKKRTLTGLFIRYICVFAGNTILLALLMLLLFTAFVEAGAVFPANYMEQWINDNRSRLINADEVSETLLPPGSEYGVYDTAGSFLYGSFGKADKKGAWEAYVENNTFAENGGYYRFLLRDGGEVCIIKYFLKTQAANDFLREHLPPPDICFLFLFIILFIVQTVLISRRFAGMLSVRLSVLNDVTEKIRRRDLEISREYSDIREIDAALASLFRMGEALKDSLNEQWRLEKHKQEQVAALAHDIKTPLTVIRGNAELLDEEALGESGREYNRYIRENAEEIENYLILLQEMLLSEDDTGESESISAEQMTEELIERAKILASGYSEGRIGIEIKKEDALFGSLVCDVSQIQRAWDNIVSNALEYTLPYGLHPLTITAETVTEDGKSYLAVRVTDRGPGFTEDALLHAAEQFYQGDKSRHEKRHKGLGLYTASKFAGRQGGKLILENAPEEGYGGRVSLLLSVT